MSSELAHLLPPDHVAALAAEWLREDTPSFDWGGFVVGDAPVVATLWQKARGVLAGRPFFDAVFSAVHCEVEWFVKEGTLSTGSDDTRVKAALVRGRACDVLRGERVALNMLARCSGIATAAREAADIVAPFNRTRARPIAVAGTRKTTPGFRLVEKYAYLVGGIDPHRVDLSNMVMCKDNHIVACGSIRHAVAKARSVAGFSVKVEVETSTYEQACEAIEAGADVVMLDNRTPEQLAALCKQIRSRYPHGHYLLEMSGGITAETLAAYCKADVDIVSMGSLSQGVGFVDFSLKVTEVPTARL